MTWSQNFKRLLRPSFYAQVQNSRVWQYISISTFGFGAKQELYPKKFMPRFGQSQKSHLLRLCLFFCPSTCPSVYLWLCPAVLIPKTWTSKPLYTQRASQRGPAGPHFASSSLLEQIISWIFICYKGLWTGTLQYVPLNSTARQNEFE